MITTEQLRAELAAREAQETAEAQHRQDTIRQAQQAYDRDVLARWKDVEASLEEDGNQALTEAKTALTAGDLTRSFSAYTRWIATRSARNHVRSAANNAANRLGVEAPGTHDLRSVDHDFGAWLRDNAGTLVSRQAADMFDEVFGGEIPTDYAAAAAWLENQP